MDDDPEPTVYPTRTSADQEECEQSCAMHYQDWGSLPPAQQARLRNHGLLTVGANPGHAFNAMYYLEKSIQVQLAAQQSGAPLNLIGDNVAESTAQLYATYPNFYERDWDGVARSVALADPAFEAAYIPWSQPETGA